MKDREDQLTLNNESYNIGWICAIQTEYVAAQLMLDEVHSRPENISANDYNDYTLGTIAGHHVVIAVLPEGEYGTSSAASVAKDLVRSFPNVRIGLMVGIGGGAPSATNDIRLGDIVVGVPGNGQGGVIQYDFGKTIQGQPFRPTGFLNQAPTVLRTAVTGLRARHEIDGHTLEEEIEHILGNMSKPRKKYQRPPADTDQLYKSDVVHPEGDQSTCNSVCGSHPDNLVQRPARNEDEDNPAIHYGRIASANQLMKDAVIRDRIATQENVLCFEMEAAGLMNQFPCLVVRGICDYSDSHKNKLWQGYAAMAAAMYAKDLLRRLLPSRVEQQEKIVNLLSAG
jgi:nucleoside phosphorylase